MATMDDRDYRKMVTGVFEDIAATFDAVDPDIAEAELSQGALTIIVGKSKIIVSPQPPVQQIWLAAAAFGVATHFNLDPTSGDWMDDKAKGLELFSYLSELVEKSSGLKINFRSKT